MVAKYVFKCIKCNEIIPIDSIGIDERNIICNKCGQVIISNSGKTFVKREFITPYRIVHIDDSEDWWYLGNSLDEILNYHFKEIEEWESIEEMKESINYEDITDSILSSDVIIRDDEDSSKTWSIADYIISELNKYENIPIPLVIASSVY